MWRPTSITCRQSIERTLLLQLPACKVCLPVRNTNDGNIESRYGKSKSGWFTRKGTKAGYPPSWPHQSRIVGIDLNLQERLDEMYKDRRKAEKNRRDVGMPLAQKETVASNRSRMLEYRKIQRADQNLERRARRNELEVDIDNVKLEHLASGALFKDIFQAADLYGVYEDLFGIDIMFRPCLDLKLHFDYDEEYVTPIFRGNVIKPNEAKSQPVVSFDCKEDNDCFWTLVMTNPDGHFTQDESEYLHWMVGNIPSSNLPSEIDGEDVLVDLASKGEIVCPYLQPFPPFGTGFHRFIFILYKHNRKLDLAEYKQPPVEENVILPERTFHTRQFFDKFENSEDGGIIPVGLAFFQSDYDSTLHNFYHNVLNMQEPKFEYHFLPQYNRPWNDLYRDHFAKHKGFNHFLDRYRDPKEIQEEVFKKRLKTIDPFKGDLDRYIKYPNLHPPHPDSKEAKGKGSQGSEERVIPTWRLREIERERLRIGFYKDMDWFEPRRDPCN